MARDATIRKPAFIWLPPESPSIYDIKIDSESVKTKIWSAEFTRALCPEIGFFKIILINNYHTFTDRFDHDDNAEFFIDRVDGTTRKFLGKIDTLKKVYDDKGTSLEVAGNHVSGELLSIGVIKSYDGTKTVSEILSELNSEFLSGLSYTIDCTSTSTITPSPKWNDKPFWDCVYDLTKLANADAYVTDDKVIKFFDKEFILNENEAIIFGQTFISSEGLGEESLTKKNKIKVYGDDGEGIPVLSVSGTGTKELAIFDSKINNPVSADELSSAELDIQNQTQLEGKAMSWLLPTLEPGQVIWIDNPFFKIHNTYPIYKFTHKFHDKTTECFVRDDKDTPHIFKARMENELALQTITNPYKCTTSLNLKFDSYDELTAYDQNISISEGKVKLSSGVEGTFLASKVLSSNISFVHLKIKGSNLIGTTYRFSTDGGTTIQYITPESKITVPSGANIWFETKINSASTEIDSIGVLMG